MLNITKSKFKNPIVNGAHGIISISESGREVGQVRYRNNRISISDYMKLNTTASIEDIESRI